VCLFSFIFPLYSTHIVGGELIYDFLGNNQYRITLKVYRDCKPGTTDFDGLAPGMPCFVFIFQSSGSLYASVDMGLPVVTSIPPTINNPCIVTPGGICVQQGVYTKTVTLPPANGGYYLVYQRCCRNFGVNNIVNSIDAGATYMEHIPGPEMAAVNSSPRFQNYPPIFICNGFDLSFYQTATDPDGDVLKYSLCPALNGLDPCCPIATSQQYSPSNVSGCINPPPSCPPNIPPPPYTPLNYIPPYSGSYPVPSNPSIQINPSTGLLSGKPTQNGLYVLKICVEEYRNNVLIGTHYQEIQLTVVNCQYTTLANFKDQLNRCIGSTITFTNQSIGASSYFWNFGDPTVNGDTSLLVNPSYTYPDTGTYQVTLIANPGKPCADTIVKKVYVYPPFQINMNIPRTLCVKKNAATFTATGTYSSGVTQFTWDAGTQAIPSVQTTTAAVSNTFVFQTPGTHTVHLYIKHFVCSDTLSDTLRVLDRPKAEIKNVPEILCAPRVITLINGSKTEYPATYQWYVNGEVPLSGFQPTFSMPAGGDYTIQLILIRYGVCPDTSTDTKIFSAFPLPNPDFVPQPTATSIFEPTVFFMNTSLDKNIIGWQYSFGDGNISQGFMNTAHVYSEPGTYSVTQTITNQYSCSASVTKTVQIWPEFRFWIPNAFTPDNNFLNEVFKPFVIGVENYRFYVFNRWGEKIFFTNRPEEGWDGTFRGKPCKSDVYAWLIEFKNVVSGQTEHHAGHVFLQRSTD